jgi:hypothetical protein
MNRLINIFIGGTTEGLKFADTFKIAIEKTGKVLCTIWTADTFQFNESFLNSLTKASITYDFGVFIASADDLAFIREKVEEIPRDNVLFEYGLFLGAMGSNRTFLIQEDGCKIPTDLQGYSTPIFKKDFTSDDWSHLSGEVLKNIEKQFGKSEIQVLPSTSLAIGYFNSFVSEVAKIVFDKDGCTLNKSKSHHKDVLFKVIIPNELSADVGAKAQIYYRKERFEVEEIGDVKRPYPIRFFKNETEKLLSIIDMPTTLNAIRPAVDLLIQDSGLGMNPDKLKLERRELENFKKTIDYLISQDDYSKDIVVTEWEVESSVRSEFLS